MEANELRIGNLAYVDNLKYHPKLQGVLLSIYGISQTSNGWSVNLNTLDVSTQDVMPAYSQMLQYIKPIPLTEEWLIKFGLTRLSKINFLLGCYELTLNPISNEWDVSLKGGIIARLEYVHQLQNLYFALTGEELTP